MDDAKAIGQTLLALRRNLELSQKAVAAKAKIPLTTVYHHERGHKPPTTDEVLAYCRALRCSFDEFNTFHNQLKEFRGRPPGWWHKAPLGGPKRPTAASPLAEQLEGLISLFADEVAKRLDHR